MPVYKVQVTETLRGRGTFIVQAGRPEAARKKALEFARISGLAAISSGRKAGKPVRTDRGRR